MEVAWTALAHTYILYGKLDLTASQLRIED